MNCTPAKRAIPQLRIHVYTLCWNEATLLPHFFRHYAFAERIVVFDNGSTDGSLDLIAAEPRAGLRHFDSGGKIHEAAYLRLKNNAWKESRGQADWVIVCDMDELLFDPHLPELLGRMREAGGTVLKPHGYEMIGERPPTPNEDLLGLIPLGVRSYRFDKCVLFDPQAIAEINYGVGAHMCEPQGRVKLFRRPHTALLHYKHLGFDYVRKRYEAVASRLSEYNLESGFGRQYVESPQRTAQRFEHWRSIARRVVPEQINPPPPEWDEPADLNEEKSRAIALLQASDWPAAQTAFEKILAYRPDDTESLANLATTLRRQNREDEAKFCLLQALGLSPDHPDIWINLANLEFSQNQLQNAANCYRNALKLQPEHSIARERLSEVERVIKTQQPLVGPGITQAQPPPLEQEINRKSSMQNTETTAAPASANPLEITTSRQFLSWLDEQKLSIALTTYQIGKLFLLGLKPNGELSIFERTFNRCMGLCPTPNGFYMSSLHQVWRFENVFTHGEQQDGYDRLYVPQVGNTTGDLDIHDMAVDADGQLVFVNTLFGCLATLSETHSFKPLWRPPFISKLAAEDRCHLNGLAMKDGRAAYVTAVSQSDVVDGWRDHRADGGVVIDVNSNEIVARGLSMPHSPRWHNGKLWLCNSGTGEFGHVELETGRFVPLTFCAGYMRGLYFHGDYALIGTSKPRHNKTFSGLPLDENLKSRQAEARCGVQVIDLRTGDAVHWLRIEGVVDELYDVISLPGVRSPMALGFKTDEIRRVISIEE